MSKPGPKMNALQRAEVRSIVATLRKRGCTQTMIQSILLERHGIEVSQPMVSHYIRQIMQEYEAREEYSVKAWVELQIDQMMMVRREAWDAYDKSKEDATKCVEESQAVLVPANMLDKGAAADMLASAERLKRIVTVQGRLPDNAYLATIMDTIKEECKLRSLYPDPKNPGGNQQVQVNIDINSVLAAATKQTTEAKLLEIVQPKPVEQSPVAGLKELPQAKEALSEASQLSNEELLKKILGKQEDRQ